MNIDQKKKEFEKLFTITICEERKNTIVFNFRATPENILSWIEQALTEQSDLLKRQREEAIDMDSFKKIAEKVELEINEKHSNYWSNIAMGNASARFLHAYKNYI